MISKTKISTKHQNSPGSPLAIDCEMVGTGLKGSVSALGRVSIVDYSENVLYDTYCLPEEQVTDFRTEWSGIRPENISNAPDFATVREQVIQLTKGRILIGHAIKNDFSALKHRHPWHLVRDTERSPWVKKAAGIETKHVSLKLLSKILLNEDIQAGEHSSLVDAICTMRIYKCVEAVWENDLKSKQDIKKNSTKNPTKLRGQQASNNFNINSQQGLLADHISFKRPNTNNSIKNPTKVRAQQASNNFNINSQQGLLPDYMFFKQSNAKNSIKNPTKIADQQVSSNFDINSQQGILTNHTSSRYEICEYCVIS